MLRELIKRNRTGVEGRVLSKDLSLNEVMMMRIVQVINDDERET